MFGLPAGLPITVADALGFYDASVRDLIARHLDCARGALSRGRTSPDLLQRQAEIALLRRTSTAAPGSACSSRFRKEVDARDRLTDEVRTGLARDQFEVHYQPIIDLRARIARAA